MCPACPASRRQAVISGLRPCLPCALRGETGETVLPRVACPVVRRGRRRQGSPGHLYRVPWREITYGEHIGKTSRWRGEKHQGMNLAPYTNRVDHGQQAEGTTIRAQPTRGRGVVAQASQQGTVGGGRHHQGGGPHATPGPKPAPRRHTGAGRAQLRGGSAWNAERAVTTLCKAHITGGEATNHNTPMYLM